jgi:hypothetical protein
MTEVEQMLAEGLSEMISVRGRLYRTRNAQTALGLYEPFSREREELHESDCEGAMLHFQPADVTGWGIIVGSMLYDDERQRAYQVTGVSSAPHISTFTCNESAT